MSFFLLGILSHRAAAIHLLRQMGAMHRVEAAVRRLGVMERMMGMKMMRMRRSRLHRGAWMLRGYGCVSDWWLGGHCMIYDAAYINQFTSMLYLQ